MNGLVISAVATGVLLLGGSLPMQEARPVRLGSPDQIIIPMGPEVVVGTGLDFDMDAGVGPAVDEYRACLGNKDRHQGPRLGAAIRAIAKCKKAREKAMMEADSALTREPGWSLKSKRDGEVKAAFDNTDASYVKMARETDAYFQRTNRK